RSATAVSGRGAGHDDTGGVPGILHQEHHAVSDPGLSGELESRGGGRAARIGVGPLAKPASPEGSVRSPGRSTPTRGHGDRVGRPVGRYRSPHGESDGGTV